MESLGERLKRKRRERKLSQEALGAAAGVYKQAVSKIERGDTQEPEARTLAQMARKLNVSLDWLITGEGAEDLPSQSVRPDPETLRQTLAVLSFVSQFQADRVDYSRDPYAIAAAYEIVASVSPDRFNREEASRRMAAWLREQKDGEQLGRGEAVGPG